MKIKHLVLSLSALALAACGNGGEEPADSTGDNGGASEGFSLGINQYMEHESLSESREGFLAELEDAGYTEGENLTVDYKNAQGDQANLQSITQQLAGNHDLILNIATPSAQAMANADPDTPQLFTAVTDPVEAGLVESIEEPGGNVTGTSDMAETAELIDLLLKADPEIQTIGIIYNSSELNSELQYEAAKEEIESRGLNVESVAVSTTNDVQSAISSLADISDGIYVPTDNTVASSIATIGQVLMDKQVPSVAAFGAGIEGTLATYGVDYTELGRQTARQALQIIEDGVSPSDIPVEYSENLVVDVNEEMAEALGIDPASLTE